MLKTLEAFTGFDDHELLANKDAVDGYPSLDNTGHILSLELPGVITDNSSVGSIDRNNRALYNSFGDSVLDFFSSNLRNASGISVSWSDYNLLDNQQCSRLNWGSGVLNHNESGSPFVSVDWQNRTLFDQNGYEIFNWQYGTFKDNYGYYEIHLFDRSLTDGADVEALNWNVRRLKDTSGYESIDWQNRVMYAPDGSTVVLQWSSGRVTGTIEGLVPIGGVIALLKQITGVPALPVEYMECNGGTVTDVASPMYGQAIPDLNNTNHFLMGAINSWPAEPDGGAATHNHTISQAYIGTPCQSVAADIQTPTADSPNIPPYTAVVYCIRIK